MDRQAFIEEVAKYGAEIAPKYGFKIISPMIGQFCKESAFGTSDKVFCNGVWRHNYGGIKYKSPTRVPIAIGFFNEKTSEEYVKGTITQIVGCFYKFANLRDCVEGYYQFLTSKEAFGRYNNIIGVTDVRSYCYMIASDGYATGSGYGESLYNDYVLKYGLEKYDSLLENPQPSQPQPQPQNNNILIAIDAGHGSNTGGKRTPDGYREHWANVKVASYFAKAMERCGVNYIKTGWNDDNATDDVDVALSTRQSQIKNAKCDYSISFHFNASGDGKSYNSGEGVETLISDKSPADSRNMATHIQNQLIKGTPQKNRGVKTQSLAMCNCGVMGTKASVLVECAFMTNKRESELMQSDAFCKECAEDSARGFCEYVGITYVADDGSSTPSVEPQPTQPTQPNDKKQVYRVRKSWEDSESQTGAYAILENARKNCPIGYSIYDWDGNLVFTPFLVKILDDDLNIRKTPNGEIVGQIKDHGKYTIIETQGSWGRLKSGVGWICISDKYVTRL